MKLILAICFGFQLTVVASVKSSPKGINKVVVQDSPVPTVAATVSSRKDCQDHICSPGWVPKTDHHQLETSSGSDSDCCLKTCELYVNETGCDAGYLPNPIYFRNVESSSQMCCDRTCQDDFQCLEVGYRSRGLSARGHSLEECCGETCSVYECPADWKSKSNSNVTFADQPSDCCNKTCKLFECNEGTEAKEDVANHSSSFTQEYCCIDRCETFVPLCPSGYGVPFKNNDSLGNIDSCCKEECKHHICGFGWDANISKALHFGDTNEHCCEATCALHTCEDMWANSTRASKLGSYNLTDESCCEASCKAHECSDGWLRNEEVIAEAGNTNETCCSMSCFLATCPAGYRKRPNSLINASLAESDDFCCEPQGCATFDNLTALQTRQCSDLDQDECDTRYIIANHTNTSALIRCEWHQIGVSTGIYTCRSWGTPVYDCTASM